MRSRQATWALTAVSAALLVAVCAGPSTAEREYREAESAADAGDWPAAFTGYSAALSYCAWAGKRLPTEAEWERACSGTSGRRHPWGANWDPSRANVTMVPLADPDDAWRWLASSEGAPASLQPVGSGGDVSPDGACDLAGNAAEWVADWYDPSAYSQLPDRNPLDDGPPWSRSVRGGAWLMRHQDANLVADASRCASRNASHSADDPRVGFRCAATLGG